MFSFLLHLSPVYYVENLHILEKEMGKITHVALLTITLDTVAYLLAVIFYCYTTSDNLAFLIYPHAFLLDNMMTAFPTWS